jgi:hypothetical protein
MLSDTTVPLARTVMLRTVLALLLLASLWPSLAAAETHSAQVPGWEPSIERLVPGTPVGALPAPGGWDLAPRPNTGRLEREGRSRLLLDADGLLGTDARRTAASTTVARVDNALLDHGVLLVRYAHLPYFATAPPSPR